ncbi:hypothetical protein [Nocardia sp. NPDC050406]|uniref:hypothetical protein n=1 Tax=Nocardia sp. NPDC050406 TaxID=3364318 RepID=UPI003794DC58
MTAEHGAETAVPVVDPTDEATRHLASAVHLDDALADAVVTEFVLEPKRAVPPSPGVRAEVVLREALAARARRRITTSAVLVLLLIFALLAPAQALLWLFVALAIAASAMVATVLTARLSPQRRAAARWGIAAALGLVLAAVVGLLFAAVVTAAEQADLESDAMVGVALGPEYLLVVALYAALLLHHLSRQLLVSNSFAYGVFQPDAPPRPFAAWASGAYVDRLRRIAEFDARQRMLPASEIVVYRGLDPFVGGGAWVNSWSKAFELHAAENGAAVPTFRPAELQDYITTELLGLRRTPTLAPGWRFSNLQVSHWALLAAGQLLHYNGARTFLNQLNEGVNPRMTDRDWASLMDSSPEWLRYYRCYRVEGWERQLVVSGYLHVGCEERTLYLEWNSYVLPPVAPEYRTVDSPSRLPVLRALWDALRDLVFLPVTVPARVVDLVRALWERSGVGRGRWHSPAQAGHVFGADLSVRELGADDDLPSFFERTDADRFLKIIERRVFEAVRAFLAERGISTAEFDAMVREINQHTVFNHCDVIAGNIGGKGNVASVHAGGAQRKA